MDRKPPITEQEFDLLERVIHRFSVGASLVPVGDDVETAQRLRERGYLRLRDGRPIPNDAGLIAANDYEHDLEGSDEVRDPLTAEEFDLLARISEGEMSARGLYQLDPIDLPLARYLASRRLVRLEDRGVELERRGHRAVYAGPAGDSPGPWAMQVLRVLPAHPRVVTWVLRLEEPLGRAVTGDILEHLARLGLATKHGADWHPSEVGTAATDATERVDPYDTWVRRHQDELGRLDNGGADFLASIRRQLWDRARDAGRDWHRKDTVRCRHLSSVLRQATERRLGHGCELAHALWSRKAYEDMVGQG